MSSRESKIDSKENSDEEEHTRLMKEQEKYNQESILEVQDIYDDEYVRIIEAREKLDRGDDKMNNLDLQDCVEEDKYLNHMVNADRGNPRSGYANDKSHEVNNGLSLIKRGPNFESFDSSFKNQGNNMSNFARRGVTMKETSDLDGYLTLQKKLSLFPLSNPRLDTGREVLASSRQDLDGNFRREIL